MKFSDLLSLIFSGFLLISVAGFILNKPILLSYVTSDSMSPTLERGDVFFINPLSEPRANDIAVFLLNDRWTVHRVVAETEGGYITKGDANVATDGFVDKSRVAGVVLQFSGVPVKIPIVGGYIEKLTKSSSFLLASVLLIFAGSLLLTGSSGRKEKRKIYKLKYKTLYTAISAVTIAVILFSIVASWGVVSFSYAATSAGGEREGWFLPGSEFDYSVTVSNRALYPVVYYLHAKSDRISLEREELSLNAGETRSVAVHVKVPDETKLYFEEIEIHSYPLILPLQVIDFMSEISPTMPLAAFAVEFGAALGVVYLLTKSEDEILKIRRVRRLKL